MVWARCWRRSPAPGRRSASTAPALLPAITPGTTPSLARRTMRSMARLTSHRKHEPDDDDEHDGPGRGHVPGQLLVPGELHCGREQPVEVGHGSSVRAATMTAHEGFRSHRGRSHVALPSCSSALAAPALADAPSTWAEGEARSALENMIFFGGATVGLFVVITLFALLTARNNYVPPPPGHRRRGRVRTTDCVVRTSHSSDWLDADSMSACQISSHRRRHRPAARQCVRWIRLADRRSRRQAPQPTAEWARGRRKPLVAAPGGVGPVRGRHDARRGRRDRAVRARSR